MNDVALVTILTFLLMVHLLNRVFLKAAFDRALREEQQCSDRSKTRNIYLNVVVNAIKRLRTEVAEAKKNPRPSTSSASSSSSSKVATRANPLTTHMQVMLDPPTMDVE